MRKKAILDLVSNGINNSWSCSHLLMFLTWSILSHRFILWWRVREMIRDQGYDQGNIQRNDQRLWFVVQFTIKLIKYDKFNDISIRRIFEKKIWNFPLPLATRITKERKKRCMILRGIQKKRCMILRGKQQLLWSQDKKKFVEKKPGFWEILDFRWFYKKFFEKSQF